MRHHCEETIRFVPFLAKAEPKFVKELIAHLKLDFFQPDDETVSLGTKSNLLSHAETWAGNDISKISKTSSIHEK